MKFVIQIIVIVGYSSIACSSQQWYQAGQDLRCQEYHKYEDPHHKTRCPKESYEEYERKRKEAQENSNTSS